MTHWRLNRHPRYEYAGNVGCMQLFRLPIRKRKHVMILASHEVVEKHRRWVFLGKQLPTNNRPLTDYYIDFYQAFDKGYFSLNA